MDLSLLYQMPRRIKLPFVVRVRQFSNAIFVVLYSLLQGKFAMILSWIFPSPIARMKKAHKGSNPGIALSYIAVKETLVTRGPRQ